MPCCRFAARMDSYCNRQGHDDEKTARDLTKNAATHNYVRYFFLLLVRRIPMELECIKYNEKMSPEHAVCRHPGDYCKYRTSCIIYFLGREKERSAHRGQNKTDRTEAINCPKDSQ